MGGTQGGAFFLDQDKPNLGRKVKSWRPRQKESAQESQSGSWRASFPTGRGLGHPCGLRLRGILPPPQEPPRPCSSSGGNCFQEPVLSEAKDCVGLVPHVKVQRRLPGCQCSGWISASAHAKSAICSAKLPNWALLSRPQHPMFSLFLSMRWLTRLTCIIGD